MSVKAPRVETDTYQTEAAWMHLVPNQVAHDPDKSSVEAPRVEDRRIPGTILKQDVHACNLHAVLGTKSEAVAVDQIDPKARNLRGISHKFETQVLRTTQ